jgi:hypothetical protein
MSIRANRSYLKDEQSRLADRISDIEIFLATHPQKYLTKRKIKGKEYYYLKFRLNEKYTSEYVSKNPEDLKTVHEEIEGLKEKRIRAKEELKKAKVNLKVVCQQLNLLNRVLENG